MPSKNEMAAVVSRDQAARNGVLDATAAGTVVGQNFKKLHGFQRKVKPEGFPTEPKTYIFSVSEMGEKVNIGAGFPVFEVFACPEGEDYGPACIINPGYFFEELKVDQTEHSFHSAMQIIDSILKLGPGMNAAWDRRKQGWFMSQTNPPRDEDVERAQSIYREECSRLVAEADRFFAAQELKEIAEIHRRSARYIKQTSKPWMSVNQQMIDCPGCMQPIPAGSIVHRDPTCGCVLDWDRAIEFGLRKLADAPPEIQAKYAKK